MPAFGLPDLDHEWPRWGRRAVVNRSADEGQLWAASCHRKRLFASKPFAAEARFVAMGLVYSKALT